MCVLCYTIFNLASDLNACFRRGQYILYVWSVYIGERFLPVVSITIPAYNAELYLAETLQSVLAQSFNDWEAIIIDDGSTDSTAGIARSFAAKDRRIRLFQQENAGLANARNFGYQESSAESEFCIFLDSDDVWEPNCLEILIAAYKSTSDSLIVYGYARYIDSESSPIPMRDLSDTYKIRYAFTNKTRIEIPWDYPTTFESLIYQNSIISAGLVLIPRSTLRAAGLFFPDLTVPGCEDWDMWLRIARQGKITLAPTVVMAYRVHPNSMSSHRERMINSCISVRYRMLIDESLSTEQRLLVFQTYHDFKGEYLQWIIELRQIFHALLESRKIDCKTITSRTWGEWKMILMFFLDMNEKLTEAASEAMNGNLTSGKFSQSDLSIISEGYIHLCEEEFRLRRSQLLEFFKERKFIQALKHSRHLPASYFACKMAESRYRKQIPPKQISSA